MFQIKSRVMQILNMRGGSIKVIRGIMRGKHPFCVHKTLVTDPLPGNRPLLINKWLSCDGNVIAVVLTALFGCEKLFNCFCG